MSGFGAFSGALLLAGIAAIFLAVALSAEPSADKALFAATHLRCVTGAAAQNPTEPNAVRPGETITLPTNETFSSVSGAEAFICLRVPHPRALGGWHIEQVQAERSHSLAQFVDGKGYRALDIFFRNNSTGLRFDLQIRPGPPGTIVGPGPPQSFAIGAHEGTLRQREETSELPPTFALDWPQDAFWFTASGVGRVQPADILPVLESIR